MDIINSDKKKALVIITAFIDYEQSIIHYSTIKGLLLADGLYENNIEIFILNSKYDIEKHNNYYYINHNLLTDELLSKFTYIFFTLHNKEIIDQLCKNTNIYQNIVSAKKINNNLLVINKTCAYPGYMDEINIPSYDFFDKIILQTEEVIIPSNVTQLITNNKNRYSIEKIMKFCEDNKLPCKFNYSEMTFNTNYTYIENDIELDNKLTNIIYLGRMASECGMNFVYLIKLMKKLGKNYKLYIIPGSFKLPNIYPAKKMSPKRPRQLKLLQNYINNYKLDYNEKNIPKVWNEKDFTEYDEYLKESNIELLSNYNYGSHFHILNKFDIGIGFSEPKGRKITVGSSKLYDYMACKLKIVFEDGLHNTKYIPKYNFGKLVSNNSTVDEFIDAIHSVENMDKNDILYDEYVKDHGYIKRACDILNN